MTTPPKSSTAALTLLALGVVYGDIGTSPLYAVKETFSAEHGIALNAQNILGGASTIFWSLMLIVTLKYVTLVMRADNRGEGGILALLALASSAVHERPRLRSLLLTIGVFGAALFYGDAVLTPAMSVLSAVEGLEVGTAAFKPYVVPIACGVLIGLFLIQRHGTGVVGALFGPVCALWFAALALAGLANIARNPAILEALNPLHAVAFTTGHGAASFVVLGGVLLAVTGAEALYADIGQFGKRAIRLAWFWIVAPALVLNYFGQGALLMTQPEAVGNPFFLAFPSWALYPMVALATAATVIASQATISGAFSITRQAIQLGYLPRMAIRHTSPQSIGQIYVPAVNWILFAAVLAAVIGFGSSSKLTSAYGVAVMGTMLITTFLTFFVIRYGWRYPLWLCVAATGIFLLVDGVFLSAALLKILDGGWFPLALGLVVFFVMMTWRRGRELLFRQWNSESVALDALLTMLKREGLPRVPGTAVFLTAMPQLTPPALLHSLKHYKVMHERVVFLTVEFLEVPWVVAEEQVAVEPLGQQFFRLRLRFGFMATPDVMRALELAGEHGLALDPMETSFFVSRDKIVPYPGHRGLARWRDRLFAAMTRNASNVTDFFNIPTNRVIELGTRVEI